MNTIKRLSALLILQSTYAASTCHDYIPDEWADNRYTIETISTDNVVTDNETGLMWKKCHEGLSGSGCNTNTGFSSFYTWTEALDLPIALNNGSGFAGYNNWRLPNIEELRSIIAFNCEDPAINGTVFPNTHNAIYWSSSPVANYSDRAWLINFQDGSGRNVSRDSANRVRLVRTVQ